MYLAYEKHEGTGQFSAAIFVAAIEYLLIAPFLMIAAIPFKDHSMPISKFIIIGPTIIMMILNLIRYFKKGKLEKLKSKFKNSRCNYRIKNWMLYLLPFFAGAWGLLGIMPISKFFQLILSLIKG